MKLVLAMDLKNNLVVHGKSGHRESYKPLDWGCSPTAEPSGFIEAIRPKYIYIADLDRIEGTGSHDYIVRECARNVATCYVDRGCTCPDDFLTGYDFPLLPRRPKHYPEAVFIRGTPAVQQEFKGTFR